MTRQQLDEPAFERTTGCTGDEVIGRNCLTELAYGALDDDVALLVVRVLA
ncbi:MAG: hypothetical protein LH469_14040 [Frankiaceae bacterium]|nr:hypothetical protein [Frankiaceae bacterium]